MPPCAYVVSPLPFPPDPEARSNDESRLRGLPLCRCQRKFNERTGTGFNFLEFPTDIVFQVVLCRLRYKLSLRDLAELFLLRGFSFTHEAVRDWEERLRRC